MPSGIHTKLIGSKTVAMALLCLCLCLRIGAVQAQQSQPPVGVIEEIVVTAQHVKSNVQDTPLAISALTGDMLEKRRIRDGNELQFFVPGLTFGKTGSSAGAQITLRGIGTETLSAGGDPGVAIHVDGVYQQASSTITQDFFDVERVEVLRGPQGTLYGRNATGGTINIINKRPTEEFEFDSSLSIGNYDLREIKAAISGPLVADVVLGRLSVRSQRRDGYSENVAPAAPEDDADDADNWSVRGQLEFRPTDDLNILLRGYTRRDDGNGIPVILNAPYPRDPSFLLVDLATFQPVIGNYYEVNNAGPNPSVTDIREYASNSPTRQEAEFDSGSLEVNWDFANVTLTSITGYSDISVTSSQDLDASFEVSLYNAAIGTQTETFSQEIRLASQGNENLDWVGGLYYYQGEEELQLTFIADAVGGATPIPANEFIINPGAVDTKSYGVFAQGTWNFNERLSLTVGGRYSEDSKDADEGIFSSGFLLIDFTTFGPLLLEQDETWSKTTGKIGVEYRVSDDVMFYGSIGSGYKSGGFNIGALDVPFDPEEVVAYEAGMKGVFLEDHLQINLAGFYYDYSDLQVFQFETTATRVTNAADATSRGVELELVYFPTENLQLNAVVGWLDATFDKFDTEDPTAPLLGTQDLSGNYLNRSPEWKYSIGGEYTWWLGDLGSVAARVDYSYTAKQYYRVFNLDRDEQESYSMTNAQLRWSSADERWQVDVWGSNLGDEEVFANITVGSALLGSPPYTTLMPPRTYGVTLGYGF